jgi:hypothetical protein
LRLAADCGKPAGADFGEMRLDRGGRIILPEFGFTGWGNGAFE